ncbi:MAG: hypothetical protein H6636_01405 [Anaerolineales bacterium]|nr:hypothetical protein [Anaerolineales bacterium]
MTQKILIPLFFALLLLTACKSEPPQENTVPEEVFNTYETAAYSLHLPDNYLGAEPGSPNLNVVVNWLSSNGYDAQGFSTFVQANAAEMLFVGVNTEQSLSNQLAYFTLSGGDKPQGFTVEQFMSSYTQSASKETLLEHNQKELGDKTVDVLLYEFANGETSYYDSFYFYITDTQLWKFEFISPKPDYSEKIEGFEQIVADFVPRTGK